MALLFFMYLVAFGRDIACGMRFPVVAILALTSAMASGFIGGSAAARGQVPFRSTKDHPVVFALGGGVAVLVVVLVLGARLYANDDCVPDPGASGAIRDAPVVGHVVSTSGKGLANLTVTADPYNMTTKPDGDGTVASTLRGVRMGDRVKFVFSAKDHERAEKDITISSGPIDLGEVRLQPSH
jgi:hypothetical protein